MDSIRFCLQLLLWKAFLRAEMRAPGECPGDVWVNSTLAAFYPDYDTDVGDDSYLDLRGNRVRTLQELLDDRADFATVALDRGLCLRYATPVCVPELEQHFGRTLVLQVRSTGHNLDGMGFSQLDICVRSEADSYDRAVNRPITLVFSSSDLLASKDLQNVASSSTPTTTFSIKSDCNQGEGDLPVTHTTEDIDNGSCEENVPRL